MLVPSVRGSMSLLCRSCLCDVDIATEWFATPDYQYDDHDNDDVGGESDDAVGDCHGLGSGRGCGCCRS